MGRENRPLNIGLLFTPSEQRIHRMLGIKVSIEEGRLMATERMPLSFYLKGMVELIGEAAGYARDVYKRRQRGIR